MSKSQRPFRSTVFTFAIVAIIGVSFLSIAVAGTSAAGFSIVDSVSEYFGLHSETAKGERSASAQRIPLDVPLHVYGTGWLRVDPANAVNLADSTRGSKDDEPLVPRDFDCSTIPSKGIDKQENLRAGAIMVHCGLSPGDSFEQVEEMRAEQGGGEPPLSFGSTDKDVHPPTNAAIQSE